MTSLAQLLIDAGKTVRGSDTDEVFVTQALLDKLNIPIDTSFTTELPADTECVVYTAAHQGSQNPQVQAAQAKNIPTFSHAEALAEFFNEKRGIAVCGVGGKSTISAMITWILEKTGKQPSYSVGVGNIIGLNKTGAWKPASEYFVAEADEYATDPSAVKAGAELIPRFHYMHPSITVATKIVFDHPDVYRDFFHTKEVFNAFFRQIKPRGTLVTHFENMPHLVNLSREVSLITYGNSPAALFALSDKVTVEAGKTVGSVWYQGKQYQFSLPLPGKFNLENAVAAMAAASVCGISLEESIAALATFQSTKRRFELVGTKNGVTYYDDYAHHPREVKAVIDAINQWYPEKRKVIAFQSHTFSRTKQLFEEFVDAFAAAQEVVMIDIFASAREAFDPTITSDLLCEAIQKKYPTVKTRNVKTIQALAEFCKTELHDGDVLITVGAGDIYKVHELI